MKSSLAEKESFWKGIAAGLLAGIGVAAALRFTPLEKLISDAVGGKPVSPLESPSMPEAVAREAGHAVVLFASGPAGERRRPSHPRLGPHRRRGRVCAAGWGPGRTRPGGITGSARAPWRAD